jgi:miniconductance mechanosensitive channel
MSWFTEDSLWGGVGLVLAGAIGAYLLIRYLALPAVYALVKRSPITWDDLLLDRRVLHRVALMFPIIVIRAGIPSLPLVSSNWANFTIRLTEALLIVLGLYALNGLFKAINNYYLTLPVSGSRPIKGYLQVLMIVASVFGAVVAVARLADQPVGYFLGGLGAMTAVLLLIFQDTILSLVASVQLTQNDMLRVGDWIEIPDIGVDGDVIDIALHTVKVQNWDKTISTVPTHRLISKTFRNWRGMTDAGGRRIKRALNLDVGSVRFLTDDESERFSKFEPLAGYMSSKQAQMDQWNSERAPQEGGWGDPRRLTNIGTFRAYVVAYLRANPALATDRMTTLVRLLAPTPNGVPLELYVFSADTDWIRYEGIQSDIFDHLLAMLPEFGLRVFQSPTGTDIRSLKE